MSRHLSPKIIDIEWALRQWHTVIINSLIMLLKIMDWQVCHGSAGKHEYAAMIAVNEPIILLTNPSIY